MQTYYLDDIYDLPELQASSAIIGNFDGVHLGHQYLINEGKREELKTLVITFSGLNKKSGNLTSMNDRINLLASLGVDYLVIFNFERIKMVFFNEFMKLLKKLKVKEITCGADFRFGYKAEGDTLDLKKQFKVKVLPYYTYNDLKVSSSVIKELLIDGDLKAANELLSRNYQVSGKVFSGNKIGRTLGYPTANIDYGNYLLPKNGVYVVKVNIKGNEYVGMANIGLNPTLNLQAKTRLEVHILDFNEDIYDEEIQISFVKYLRGEQKYHSKEELIKSLAETVIICSEYK